MAMTTEPSFSVGLVQMGATEDRDQNLARAGQLITEAARAGAAVVCLPELFRTRYFCQTESADAFDLAESIPGPTTEALAAEAVRTGVVLIAPVFERQAAGLYYNTAVVIDRKGRLAGRYRKMHVPDDPGYYEKYYFTPGDLGFQAFDTEVGRVGVLICWDQWFPEAARLTAMCGAAVLFYPTAIGWHPRDKAAEGVQQRDAWQTVQRGHAIANGVYVAAVNRVGTEVASAGDDGIEFWGSSFVADPQGVIVAQAPDSGEQVLVATVDMERLEDVRRNWPFWRDRRVDAYDDLVRRFCDPSDCDPR